MLDDLTTGLEIELVLPEGMTRLDLLDALAARFGGTIERFVFPSMVPVPSGLAPAATIALVEDVARHHQAKIQGVSPDYRHFYLAHRAGRWLGGPLGLSIVHDNTLSGGERVAELVTAPFLRDTMPALAEVLRFVGAIDGVATPDTAALHVHVDGARFRDARALRRLVAIFERSEPTLRAALRSPSGLRRARPIPRALVDGLEDAETWPEVEALLRAHVPDRGSALNLYNLAANDPKKLTVELKLAGSTLDPEEARTARELTVAMGLLALSDAPLALDATGAPTSPVDA